MQQNLDNGRIKSGMSFSPRFDGSNPSAGSREQKQDRCADVRLRSTTTFTTKRNTRLYPAQLSREWTLFSIHWDDVPFCSRTASCSLVGYLRLMFSELMYHFVLYQNVGVRVHLAKNKLNFPKYSIKVSTRSVWKDSQEMHEAYLLPVCRVSRENVCLQHKYSSAM